MSRILMLKSFNLKELALSKIAPCLRSGYFFCERQEGGGNL